MPYVIELEIDDPGALAVKALLDRVEASGLPTYIERVGYKASIPLAVFGQLDASHMRLEIKRYAMGLKPFDLNLSGVGAGCDPRIAGLTCDETPELKQAHVGIYSFLRKVGQSPRKEYEPGSWVPLVPLGENYNPVLVERLRRLSEDWEMPIKAHVANVRVSNVNPSRSQTIFHVQLESGAVRDRS
ncbi:MAG: hypothetical protein KF784_08800 [Fimbriimonadaceae bacterium]|nr:hypothetical protein [Fimbriimonadaceae bacterium]